MKPGLSGRPLQVLPTSWPYLDRLWGSYELLLDLLLLDVLVLITWVTVILWVRMGYLKNLHIYLPTKEKTQWNPAAVWILLLYQTYIGFLLKSMLDFRRKVTFYAFFYEVRLKKVTVQDSVWVGRREGLPRWDAGRIYVKWICSSGKHLRGRGFGETGRTRKQGHGPPTSSFRPLLTPSHPNF